jgi:hypothetical protein
MTYPIRDTTHPHPDPQLRPCVDAIETSQPASETYCPRKTLADEVWRLVQFDLYRPELHYMRGPGPKWHAKRERAFALLDKMANEKRAQSVMLRTLKNWPNATFAAICAGGILCVLLPLAIATSLVASSSSSVNAESPGQACFAVSKSEYKGAYRKNLLLTRFGAYERTGRLGRYSYWYCR